MEPIDISDSAVRQTVRFDRPTKGRDLIDAVKATCELTADDFGTKYAEAKETPDGDSRRVVGQSSSYEYKNLVVAPDSDNAFIEPDSTYAEAVVVRHDVPAGSRMRFAVRHYPEDEAAAVGDFAKHLQQTLQQRHAAAVGLDRGPITRDPAAPAAQTQDPARDLGQRQSPDSRPPGKNLSRG